MIALCLYKSNAKKTNQNLPWCHHTSHQRDWTHTTTTVLKHTLRTEKVVHRLHRINTTRAVALAVVVNSPGGMPVQSEIIAAKIKDFSVKHNLKLYTFARDVAASGGYMVLSTGDHVVADYSSIVGSIGVVFQKLKLKGLLDQLSS